MDEEPVKPCIQDRLRSAATRSKEIFASWPIIIQFLILIFFLLPEIMHYLLGMEGTMPILSRIPIEGRIAIVFSSSIAIFSSLQYNISKSLLRIEEQRSQPFLSAEMDITTLIIDNSGGGVAWGFKVSINEAGKDKQVTRSLKKFYPRSRIKISIQDEFESLAFAVIEVKISYYLEEKEINKIEWESTFKITPTVRWG